MSWDKKIILNIKQVFHYQVRQVFFFKNGRKDKKNKNKNNEFLFNFFFLW